MHSLRGKRGLFGGLMFALAAIIALPVTAHAGPDPEAKRSNTGRYRLFAGNLGAITVNRVYYGLNTLGEVGVDSTNSSTIGGGFWPKGTANQYMFNSGLQVAGVIQGTKPANPWGGDTTGGFFFDARGTNQHGSVVTELYNSTSPTDRENWPQAGLVPEGDESEDLFYPLLRGRINASQGDVWWLTTEANPEVNAGRPHPLGIVAEYRVMGWNYPTGNEDLLYLIITFYNVTTSNPAAYAHYRDGLRELLIEQAQLFQSRNNATFNVTLPADGYTIDPFYAAFAADPDVTDQAGRNFASVNMPFAMSFTYHADFPRQAGWTFPPDINGPPFFPGVGFVGIKYLKSATGEGEIALFSNTCNGCGQFNDPPNTTLLYKILSGNVTAADGYQCNQGDVTETRICWIRDAAPADVRVVQSSTALALEAGQSASIVVSYIHAAPVTVAGYTPGTIVLPGDPRKHFSVDGLSIGDVNLVDQIQGFLGYSDANEDGEVQQDEYVTVPGSLLSKALIAQQIFNNAFLLPFAPEAPDFFLVPNHNQVTVVWRPSASETEGDPFYQVAGQAMTSPPGGGEQVVNPLYDANYRNFDVEGYRIYRGRVDTPTGLQLIEQFDYAGTTFNDYTGQVVSEARGPRCAPEIDVISSCGFTFDDQSPGNQLEANIAYDLNGPTVQVQRGNRAVLQATGDVLVIRADTAVTGGGSGFPALSNTGVPFVYIDNTVRNGLTYFYAVTAFDVNSINSTGAGNTSLESARITKRVVPRAPAGNYANEATIQRGVFGRSGLLTDNEFPTVDAQGRLTKRFPPTDAVTINLAGFVRELISQPGEISLTLDSIKAVSFVAATSVTADHFFTLITPLGGSSKISARVTQPQLAGRVSTGGSYEAIEADPTLSGMYSAPTGSYRIGGTWEVQYPGLTYIGARTRGCLNGQTGYTNALTCIYNSPRWFSGPNETKANPSSSNPGRWQTGNHRIDFSNGGELPGVATIYEPSSYDDYSSGSWRDAEMLMGLFASAADYNVYWGDGGKIDSVIDVTHDVVVPFSSDVNASWGILNASAVPAAGSPDLRTELSVSDMSCVNPLRAITSLGCTAPAASLSETAVPGPVVYGSTITGAPSTSGATTIERTAPVAPGPGFVFYIKGHAWLMELEGSLPAAGTVWTFRDYVGVIRGGTGRAGNSNGLAYVFNRGTDATNTDPQRAPFTAIGSSVKFAFDLDNAVVASTAESMNRIHTVPDPYYVTSAFEATTSVKQIKFVNLPTKATVRVYSTSGVLVRVLEHDAPSFSGELVWDVRNRNNQFVASGVYFYHVTAENGETFVGRMTIINYANQ